MSKLKLNLIVKIMRAASTLTLCDTPKKVVKITVYGNIMHLFLIDQI